MATTTASTLRFFTQKLKNKQQGYSRYNDRYPQSACLLTEIKIQNLVTSPLFENAGTILLLAHMLYKHNRRKQV